MHSKDGDSLEEAVNCAVSMLIDTRAEFMGVVKQLDYPDCTELRKGVNAKILRCNACGCWREQQAIEAAAKICYACLGPLSQAKLTATDLGFLASVGITLRDDVALSKILAGHKRWPDSILVTQLREEFLTWGRTSRRKRCRLTFKVD